MDRKTSNMQIPTFLQKSAEKAVETSKNYREAYSDDEVLTPSTNMTDNTEEELCENNAEYEEAERPSLSSMERDAFVQHVKGMSREQIDIMLDNIPIEMVYNRLGRELERNKAFMNAMKEGMSLIGS